MKTFTERDYEYNRAGYQPCLIVFTVGLAVLVLITLILIWVANSIP